MTLNSAILLGALSPLGAALIRQLSASGFDRIIAIDTPDKTNALRALTDHLSPPGKKITVLEATLSDSPSSLEQRAGDQLEDGSTVLFHLDHTRDRSLSSSEIRQHNHAGFDRVVSLSCHLSQIDSVVVVTDAGIVGDYPGRFSEQWVDVDQTPFDEVDKSSMEVELRCIEEAELPILRARVGIVLDPHRIPRHLCTWKPAKDELLHGSKLLKKLPRFLHIPVSVAKNALAPITPADWGSKVLVNLCQNKKAHGSAVHLIIEEQPSMDEVLRQASAAIGGANLTSGLPGNIIAKLGIVPGLTEFTRKQGDHMASWWTPHRYCLSRNELDTSHLKKMLPPTLSVPSWDKDRAMFT